MMDRIWIFMIMLSFLVALFMGRMNELAASITKGAEASVSLCISILGTMCLWRGLMEVMSDCGLSGSLRRILRPLLRRLFKMKNLSDSEKVSAEEAICANVSANIMGLANAATPFGIEAARRLHDGSSCANDDLCTLVILNSASVTLIPATVAAIRASLGCAAPYDILPSVWIASASSVIVGLLAAKTFSKGVKQ